MPRKSDRGKLTVASVDNLPSLLAQGAAIVDLRPSLDYRSAHLEGAIWSIRPAIQQLGLERDRPVMLIGAKPEVELAAYDLKRDGFKAGLHWLQSGPAEWRDAGLAIIVTPDSPPDAACIDFLFFVHDRHDGNMEAARRYLEWEQGLIEQLDAQERAEFAIGPSPFPAS
jgi:rhodanese-related sulfurtransferase